MGTWFRLTWTLRHTVSLSILDPFGRAKPRLSKRSRDARLRVNFEQAPAFRPGSREVHFQDMKQFEGDRLISIQVTAKKSLISSVLPVLPVLPS